VDFGAVAPWQPEGSQNKPAQVYEESPCRQSQNQSETQMKDDRNKSFQRSDPADKAYLPKPQPDGSWLAQGIGDFSQKKTFSLAPGASFELYHGYDQITSPPDTPGAGWTESMSGDCTCTAH
jgi:hypothetical protein